MPKYTIKEVGKRFGDNQDWLSVTFEEYHSEPTMINLPSTIDVKPGMKINGVIGKTSKGKRVLKPAPKEEAQPKRKLTLSTRDALIVAQSQIANALQRVPDYNDREEITNTARMYMDIVLELAEERLA